MKVKGSALGCGEMVEVIIEIGDEKIIKNIKFKIDGPLYLKEEAEKIKKKLIGNKFTEKLIKDILTDSGGKSITIISALFNALNEI